MLYGLARHMNCQVISLKYEGHANGGVEFFTEKIRQKIFPGFLLIIIMLQLKGTVLRDIFRKC